MRVPKWSDPSADALLRNGTNMLKEQDALDEKRLFDKIVEVARHPAPAQGTNPRTREPPMRKFVTANIRSRMIEERDRDPEYNLDRQQTDQRVITIKKELNLMANARRELTVFRKEEEAKWEKEAANMASPEHTPPGGQKRSDFRRSLAPSAAQGSEQPEQLSSFLAAASTTRASTSVSASEGLRNPKGWTYAPRFPETPKAMPSPC